MKRYVALGFVFVAGSLSGGIQACSGGNAEGPGDSGTDVTELDSGGQHDASPDAATDSPPDQGTDSSAEAEAGPPCLQLAVPTPISTERDVLGITTDGYVMSDVPDGGTNATPLDGGATTSTGLPANTGFGFAGPLYMVANNGAFVATWQAGVLGTGTPLAGGYLAVSSDGQHMVSAGNDGSVTYAKTDMSGQVTLVPAMDGGAACSAVAGFAGNYLVVASFACTSAGVPLAATITSYALPSLTPATILTNAQPFWSADSAGTQVFAMTTGGAASVFPIAGGAGTPIDTNVWSGFMTPDGMNVLYATTTGQLKRAATSNPQPTVLVSSGVYDFPTSFSWESVSSYWLPAQSPDGSQILTCGSAYCATGGVAFASTTTAGSATTIVASGGLYGQDAFFDPFTHDGTYALVRTIQNGVFGASNLIAAKVGGSPQKIATKSSRHFAASTGAKVVYDENFVDNMGISDLYVVDLASSCRTPTLVASGIDGFWVNAARDTIVYAQGGGQFTVPVP
ncbi:MAG TPA: hypothetical protein VF765_34610 [Polyangiaceae bacterium]